MDQRRDVEGYPWVAWSVVPEFPNYSVSNTGHVRSDIQYKNGNVGHILKPATNQRGIVNVGLMHNGIQYRRSVALLVAQAFLKTARPLHFTTPINLNGERYDNHVENLQWRPLWFARRYHTQFSHGVARITSPIVELGSGDVFPDSWVAAVTYGLLDCEIFEAVENKTYVWPTYQRFEVM
jgi:hypothetical protein